MIDELKCMIKNAEEDEIRSLLLQVFLRINMAEEAQQYREKQLISDLQRMYHDYVQFKRGQQEIESSKDYKAIHIAFGDSAAGSLNNALNTKTEKVISFSDQFAIGPVWRLHEPAGIQNRYKWIENHLIFDDDYLADYQHKFRLTISMIHSIPSHIPIKILAGNNAHDQTALRFVIYLLRAKPNEIYLIDASNKQFQNNVYSYAGEIPPEKLKGFYDANNLKPLSREQRQKLVFEWLELTASKEVLRIWKHDQIQSVNDSFYDNYVIRMAERLHNEQQNKTFMKSARLIGEVIGHLDQYIGDTFLEYRLRYLIMNGIFDIEGVPKAMRFYSVKLR